ncbi:MAG TPA: hypothetical protein VJH37_03970 [Candidatus Nanoarchaeia archaeon]|nr:hypothetical protein [Candidatus Nanoarchaeia archaeon]
MPFVKGGVNQPNAIVNELASMNIELQKVTVQLIDKMNNLTVRIDRMLSLFEDAARNLSATDDASGMKTQLQELVEQNKAIARGLLSIEKYVRERQPAQLSTFQQKPGYP